MNTEELKRRLAKEGAVTELDTRDAYAVEWTVAAMSESNVKVEGAEKLIETAKEACMLIIGAYEGYRWENAASLEVTASQMFEYAKAGYAATQPSNEAGERK